MKPRSPLLLMGLLSWIFGCGGPNSTYHQEKGEWYFKKDPMGLAKGETLTPLNKHFAKSYTTAYYESSVVDSDVDIASFEALNDHWAKDKNRVWWCDTYRKGQEYYTVKHYRSTVMRGVDAPSFRMLDDSYARDTNRVFTDGEGFEVRDINTYERIGDNHARDKISGYYMRAEIKGSDGSTFTAIDGHYSKDAKNVFWSDYDSNKGAHAPKEISFKIAGADPATFAMLESFYGADVNRVYYEGKVISNAPKTFKVLERGYAVSDSGVFYRGEALKGADPPTFVVISALDTNSATAQDKHGKFNYEKRVQQ